MADDTVSARRALALSTFGRLKDVVRELEDNEKRLSRDFPGAAIEFRVSADDTAWYVAYKTNAEALALGSPIERAEIKG